MSATTSNDLVERHAQLIESFGKLQAGQEAAKGKGDKKAAQSAGGTMANRSRQIAETELDMTLAGIEFEPWTKPNAARSRLQPMTQGEIESKIEPLVQLLRRSDVPDGVRHSADNRIGALLKAAERRGYTFADPRPQSSK